MVGLVVSNLLYPVIAVGVAVVLCVVVVLRHRRPKSVEANMRAFNRGLRALAPEPEETAKPPVHRRVEGRPRPGRPGAPPVRPSRPRGTDPVHEAEAETG